MVLAIGAIQLVFKPVNSNTLEMETLLLLEFLRISPKTSPIVRP